MYKMKTRVAYFAPKGSTQNEFCKLCDTVEEALKANMLVKDYEKQLIELNPQFNIIFKIEEVNP